jgi:hypothetical protein
MSKRNAMLSTGIFTMVSSVIILATIIGFGILLYVMYLGIFGEPDIDPMFGLTMGSLLLLAFAGFVCMVIMGLPTIIALFSLGLYLVVRGKSPDFRGIGALITILVLQCIVLMYCVPTYILMMVLEPISLYSFGAHMITSLQILPIMFSIISLRILWETRPPKPYKDKVVEFQKRANLLEQCSEAEKKKRKMMLITGIANIVGCCVGLFICLIISSMDEQIMELFTDSNDNATPLSILASFCLATVLSFYPMKSITQLVLGIILIVKSRDPYYYNKGFIIANLIVSFPIGLVPAIIAFRLPWGSECKPENQTTPIPITTSTIENQEENTK